jgi:hypothetical protein
MKRIVSSALFIIAFVGLGAWALMSLPQGDSTAAVAPAAEVAVSTSAEVANENSSMLVDCGQPLCFNMVAVPLEQGAAMDTAQEFLNYVVSFCSPACAGSAPQVLKWNAATQSFISHANGAPFPPPYAVATGDGLFFTLNNGYNADTFTFVGDVSPRCTDDPINCVQYDFSVAPTGRHLIMLPLEKASLTTAEQLLDDIDAANAAQALRWNATTQSYVSHANGAPFPPPFAVSIGYPYFVRVSATTVTTWP